MLKFKAASKEIHPLFKAILNKTPKDVEQIIDAGADVNMRIPDGGKTLLHVATHRGDLAMVQMLLRKKADVSAITEAGFTALHVAAQNNNPKIIDILVAAGASVNTASKVGCTPLHESAAKGHKEATIKLLELKADPNLKDFRYNLSAANLAMQNGHLEVGKLLWRNLDYQESFVQTVNLMIYNFKNKYLENSPEVKFIQNLANNIKTAKDADEVFKCLHAALKSAEFILIKKQLSTEKKALIILMQKYNDNKAASAKKTETPPSGSDQLKTTSENNEVAPNIEGKKDKEAENIAVQPLTSAFSRTVSKPVNSTEPSLKQISKLTY